ncbi:hypothetical protein ACKI14_49460, partial [Streptomyces turgidiscabies]|uniref:hypothetical protein n=1 Tax=Streptomyces turgidiscabies TaxID=85558 RepID=UPI0038F79876
EYTSDYQYLAARLLMFKLRKQAYGKYTPTSFYSHIKKLTTKGIYDKEIIEKYSRAEINSLEKVINHEADLKLSYAAARQYQRKYLIK